MYLSILVALQPVCLMYSQIQNIQKLCFRLVTRIILLRRIAPTLRIEGLLKKPLKGVVAPIESVHRHSGESRNPFLRLLPFVRFPAHRRGMKHHRSFTRIRKWIPAFAGMTTKTRNRAEAPLSLKWLANAARRAARRLAFATKSDALPAGVGSYIMRALQTLPIRTDCQDGDRFFSSSKRRPPRWN